MVGLCVDVQADMPMHRGGAGLIALVTRIAGECVLFLAVFSSIPSFVHRLRADAAT